MAEVVLVHGAWHGAWCWDGVVAELDRRRIQAAAVELPLAGLAADVAAARVAIEAAGPGSVVVGHSYGGSVISLAAAGLPVARLIYLAALLTENRADTYALISDKLRQARVTDERGVSRVDPAAAAGIFYGDADPAAAATMVSRLRSMTPGTSTPPDIEPAWKSVPVTYVVCTNDQAIPPSAQRQMAEQAETVLEWPTDHSPFITRPAAVAELIARYA
jgi:pimeloyl-ACP methyl ester carboxylesterase